jgi:hypothetical protein
MSLSRGVIVFAVCLVGGKGEVVDDEMWVGPSKGPVEEVVGGLMGTLGRSCEEVEVGQSSGRLVFFAVCLVGGEGEVVDDETWLIPRRGLLRGVEGAGWFNLRELEVVKSSTWVDLDLTGG